MRKLFEKSQRELEKLLDIYEQRLEEAAYLAGDKFTIADLSHLPNADRLASDPRSRRMFERRRNVSRWWNDVSRRESWAYVKSLQRPPSSNGADADAAHAQNGQTRVDGDSDSKHQGNRYGDNDNNHQRNQYGEAKDYQQGRPSADGRY
jgi:glutathione S-transferase